MPGDPRGTIRDKASNKRSSVGAETSPAIGGMRPGRLCENCARSEHDPAQKWASLAPRSHER